MKFKVKGLGFSSSESGPKTLNIFDLKGKVQSVSTLAQKI